MKRILLLTYLYYFNNLLQSEDSNLIFIFTPSIRISLHFIVSLLFHNISRPAII